MRRYWQAGLGWALAFVVIVMAVTGLTYDSRAESQVPRSFLPLLTRGYTTAPRTRGLELTVERLAITANGDTKFIIQITNTTQTTITVLPFEFVFPASAYRFRSTNIPGSTYHTRTTSSEGTLIWPDLTMELHDLGPAGTPDASLKVEIVLIVQQCSHVAPIVQATISYAQDISGFWLAPVTGQHSSALNCVDIALHTVKLTRPEATYAMQDVVEINMIVERNDSGPPMRGIRVAADFDGAYLRFMEADIRVGGNPVETLSNIAVITPTNSVTFTLDFSAALDTIPLEDRNEWKIRARFQVVRCPQNQRIYFQARMVGHLSGERFVLPKESAPFYAHTICPALRLTKTLGATSQNRAQIGETITFTIRLEAIGNLAITILPMDDHVDEHVLRFMDADYEEDPMGPLATGVVTWSDLIAKRGRPLEPGEAITVTVVYQIIGCTPSTDRITRTAASVHAARAGVQHLDVTPALGPANLDIICPALQITHQILSPRNRLLHQTAQEVTYSIIVTNTGNLPLVTIPVTDTFDSRVFTVTNTSLAPLSSTSNELYWNLAPAALVPGRSISVTLTLETTQCPLPTDQSERVNWVEVAGAQARVDASTLAPVERQVHSASINFVCSDLIMTQTLIAPGDGVASPYVSDRNVVTFRFDISNTGNITVEQLPLTIERFPHLVFDNYAIPLPDRPLHDRLIWSNLATDLNGGPLAPLQQRSVIVRFRAMSCPIGQETYVEARIHDAIARDSNSGESLLLPPVPTVETARIACPGVEVQSSLVRLPECGVIGVEQAVAYRIIVRNTGNSTLTTLPLTNTYEADFMEFVSATPAISTGPTFDRQGEVLRGTLSWLNLAALPPYGVGHNLDPGSEISLTVILRSRHSTSELRRHPHGQTVNYTQSIAAMDVYGFITTSNQAGPSPIQIQQADVLVEVERKAGLSEQIEVQSNERPVRQMNHRILIPGELVTYTIRFKNNGPDDARRLRIVGQFSPGLQYMGHSPHICDGQDLREGCYVGALEAYVSGTPFEVYARVPLVSEGSPPPGTVLTLTVRIETGLTPDNVPVCSVPDGRAENNTSSFGSSVLGEFGDLPELDFLSQQPLRSLPGYNATLTRAFHGNFLYEWLGLSVSGERGANDIHDVDGAPNSSPLSPVWPFNFDFYDDGVILKNPFDIVAPLTQRVYTPGERAATARLLVSVANPSSPRYALRGGQPIYVTAWVDANRNRVFEDPNEILFQWYGGPGRTGYPDGIEWSTQQFSHRPELTNIRIPTQTGWMMARVRLSYGSPPTPEGPMDFGELEDYLIGVFEPNRTPPFPPPGPHPPTPNPPLSIRR